MLSPLLAVAAILAGITIVSLGQGVFAILVPIRLTEAGLSADRVGLVVAASAVGFLAGCLVVGRLIRLVGHIRAFSAFAAASCLAGLALPWTIGLPGWVLLRLAMGFCSAGLFMVAESWLNELTPRHLRGRILTSYVIVIMLALGAGQLLLTVVDTGDVLPFVLASAAFTLALIPVTLTRVTPSQRAAPDPADPGQGLPQLAGRRGRLRRGRAGGGDAAGRGAGLGRAARLLHRRDRDADGGDPDRRPAVPMAAGLAVRPDRPALGDPGPRPSAPSPPRSAASPRTGASAC